MAEETNYGIIDLGNERIDVKTCSLNELNAAKEKLKKQEEQYKKRQEAYFANLEANIPKYKEQGINYKKEFHKFQLEGISLNHNLRVVDVAIFLKESSNQIEDISRQEAKNLVTSSKKYGKAAMKKADEEVKAAQKVSNSDEREL